MAGNIPRQGYLAGIGMTVDLRWETPPMESFPSAPAYEGPDAKTEFRNKLGLRLEPIKGKIRTFAVDHIDSIPTEN